MKASAKGLAWKVIAPATVMALGALLSTSAAAQSKALAENAKPSKASNATPHMADEHPNLTGIWGNDGGFILKKVGNKTYAGLGGGGRTKTKYDPKDPDQIQARLQGRDNVARRSAPNQPPYKPELMAKVEDLDKDENQVDPAFLCHPSGVPRMGPPRQIFSFPGEVVFLYTSENGAPYRVIHTDGRPHRTDVDASYMGDSTAHWEGDTLVVDAVNFTDDTWLGVDGWFHSTKMHVIERFTREGDSLTYRVTVEDPEVFTRPWEMNPRVLKLDTSLGNDIVEEGPCVEVDRGHMVSHEHN